MIKNKIQKIYAAKSSLRAKLFLGFIILSLVLSSVLGFTLYQVSSSVYYKSFLQHKKSLGISISSSIDGEIFQSFITEKSSETPEFKRYFNFMQRVSANEEYITWIYSVLIDKKTNKLIYAIDATHISEDTIWIENMFIGLKVYINRNGRLVVYWDSIEHVEDFQIVNKGKKFEIEIDSLNETVSINKIQILKVTKKNPFTVETKKGILNKENPAQTATIKVEEESLDVSLNFAEKNSQSSIPGWEFIETEDLVNKIKGSINTCTFHMQNEPEQLAYGTFNIVIAPIFKSHTECIGAVIFSVSISDIRQFNKTMMIAGFTVTIIALILSVIVSYILSIFFTDPLHKLSQAVDELSSGNMETNVIIQSKDEFGFLSEKFNEMVANLKKAYKEKESLAALRHELNVAQKIQTAILPKSIPNLPNLDIAVNYYPMTQIGGDYYDFHMIDKNKIGIFIADVSGHGIPAAIIASMLKIAFSIESAFAEDPSRLLSRINQSMLNKVGTNFISASYIYIDLETNKIKHAKAGHPSIYIHSPETDEVKEFNQKGKIIGLFPEIQTETVEISIQKGDRIILYTDGIIEARNSKEEMFGEELFVGYIRKHNSMKPADFARLVMNDVKSWIGNNASKHSDDVTLMVVDIK
ncbi:MAG TPA: SpoIIE family protein phosphatase [Leptospiraceae bacterium]|nr:SpoIIE family protein phosphatase [Leptospiraceae bacterium]HMW07904.1 SpoIIE family protein phosphatase [Leptospiraceae bacterium]HMY31167.1 SpoIIE family protein phosphatase [Leptospiraceae bacterium]HMZ65412.1 SpoIIE family protein phosphatase [Leptospiraceae bacterium]HNA06050.1 SpoIIE family protein phosphatase [Leptospiraceae bacterium]